MVEIQAEFYGPCVGLYRDIIICSIEGIGAIKIQFDVCKSF